MTSYKFEIYGHWQKIKFVQILKHRQVPQRTWSGDFTCKQSYLIESPASPTETKIAFEFIQNSCAEISSVPIRKKNRRERCRSGLLGISRLLYVARRRVKLSVTRRPEMEKPVSSMNMTRFRRMIKESRRNSPSTGWTFPGTQGFLPDQWHPQMVHSISMVEGPLYLDNQVNLPISSGASIPLESSSSITQDVGTLSQATVRKRSMWTEEEHRNFLRGIEIYGKGRWNLISKKVVKTKTPSQVASHAQKYFIRKNVAPDKRKRSSIHDITDAVEISAPQRQPRRHHIASPAEPPALFLQQQLQHPTALTAQLAEPVESQASRRIPHLRFPIRSADDDLFDYMLQLPDLKF